MHLMIDLETLGTKPDAVVLSAGLVLFDHKKGIVDKKEIVLNVQEQLDAVYQAECVIKAAGGEI